MADADVPITAGAGTKIDTRTVGAGTDEHRQVTVVGDPAIAANVANVALVGTTGVQQQAGASYATASGTITTAASTVASGNVGLAGNITVFIYGTHAGVNASFEISPDNTNWFPVAATREDTAGSETTTGVLPANTARAWTLGAPGFAFFRVRATAWTSGTANVAIVAGTYPFEPMVSNVARKDTNRQAVFLGWNALTGTAGVESALTNFTAGNRAGTALTAATSYTVTAGKTLRIQEIHVFLKSTSTVVNIGTYSLRQAASGIANTSPVIWQGFLGITAATAAANTSVDEAYTFPDGFEIAGGQQITFTYITSAATCTVSFGLTGYEY